MYGTKHSTCRHAFGMNDERIGIRRQFESRDFKHRVVLYDYG